MRELFTQLLTQYKAERKGRPSGESPVIVFRFDMKSLAEGLPALEALGNQRQGHGLVKELTRTFLPFNAVRRFDSARVLSSSISPGNWSRMSAHYYKVKLSMPTAKGRSWGVSPLCVQLSIHGLFLSVHGVRPNNSKCMVYNMLESSVAAIREDRCNQFF